ncbi:IucA/IucC family protein [Streptomyces sp. NPDC002779]|uniref:IucA/IucC family protein n=1 Tax=Streptomyces sp. NPDC002779 TaxID=3364664 RepID=UPI0036C99E56
MISHLTPDLWDRATRSLLAKAIGEFAHERLFAPSGTGPYVVSAGDGGTYTFTARRYSLDHWAVDADSIVHRQDGKPTRLDALSFFTGLRGELGLSDDVLPVYLEEITSTLSALAAKLDRRAVNAKELAGAGFQEIEAGMTEGHPCFVANSGRLGFAADEYAQYAPETGRTVRLVWLAAHRDRAVFSCGEGLDYQSFVQAELGERQLACFHARLRALGLDPDDYLLMPVHPWQWRHKLAVTFAAELAERRLVHLGVSQDAYQPQQSIRTFFNTTSQSKHYVKTALSILNMGFMRGLSADYMAATPAINDWLYGLVAQDAVLRGTGVIILRERAAVGYRHAGFENATDKGSCYRKMLAALWRESPVPLLREGEQLATMASLLHTDADGGSFAAALIERSGLPAEDWLRGYLRAYLTPIVHCFFRYGLAFMPHGENVILGLENGAVTRAFFKDIAEEIAVMDPSVELPPQVERVRVSVPQDIQPLSVFTDVFDCFFRFLAPVLDEAGVLPEESFWQLVAECIRGYGPAAASLFTPAFALSCLNRLQLSNNRQMLDLTDPSGALRLAGLLPNPVAAG